MRFRARVLALQGAAIKKCGTLFLLRPFYVTCIGGGWGEAGLLKGRPNVFFLEQLKALTTAGKISVIGQ